MHKSRWNLALGIGLVFAVALACNWSTAKLDSLKISKDEAGKEEKSEFGPGDKVYSVTEVANNPGKVTVKFKVLYDDVAGKKSGDVVEGSEKSLEVEGSRTASFWVGLPSAGFDNGRYKVDIVMLNEKGEQKDQKSGTFKVSGY